nr:ribosome maturation factor RimP [Corynebacterium lactis]
MAIPAPEKIEEILAPALSRIGLDIEAVKVVRAGAKSQVVVSVDGETRPDLDGLEEATRVVSEELDAAEAAGAANFGAQGYTLEVSTPGIDAPLVKPRHWRRNLGRLVQVSLADGTTLPGRIGALSEPEDAVIIVSSAGPKGRPRATGQVLRLADIARAVVQVEFSTPPAVEMEFVGLTFDDALNRLEDDK